MLGCVEEIDTRMEFVDSNNVLAGISTVSKRVPDPLSCAGVSVCAALLCRW